ncbi:hypothetical protein AAC387_Pa02g4627 [Persea americana]
MGENRGREKQGNRERWAGFQRWPVMVLAVVANGDGVVLRNGGAARLGEGEMREWRREGSSVMVTIGGGVVR